MHRYSDILRVLFEKKGITDEKEIEIFLNPDYVRDLHDPFLMRDMERACVRLYEAIKNDEKIVIYADYDCDGIPGAVILADLFKKIKYENFEVYIPLRNAEGYGLNKEAIQDLASRGTKLLITVDLGITAVEEVAQAKELGIDVIITDHHLASKDLPQAFAILNPKIDNYPDKNLCGAGVAFKLAYGFIKKYGNDFYKINEGWEKWLLDMAGLATLSDMVPLVGENRALAFFGLKVLRKSARPGLQKLLAKVKIDQRYLCEDDITFMVTPRINAASRMDDPMRAYELLATSNHGEAGSLAEHLSKINDDRKNIVAQIVREVKKNFEKREMREVIVVGNPSWKVGVLGIVAGKLSEEYECPVFCWGEDENDFIKGSCRAPEGVSVVDLMKNNEEFFLEFGGHDGAGGFTVVNEKIHFLEDALIETFREIIKNTTPHSPLSGGELNTTSLDKGRQEGLGDLNLNLSDVNLKNWKEIEKMAPFGIGNHKPVFLFENILIQDVRKFGKNGSGEHLEITFTDDDDREVKGIAFFSGHDSFGVPLQENKKVNLLANFDFTRFRGKEELRLRIIDIF